MSVVQVIDFDGNFRTDLSDQVQSWNFKDRGSDYFIVAVLGCQSSGKSTLLNRVFATSFEVLDVAVRGTRGQTTKGVWMGKTESMGNYVLVFDVEGTDSKERGEEHTAWERKTSLFSLALSEVLIINLWAKDLGRFDGANYGLLKNVFELNLKLFQSGRNGKTLLFFVLRDYEESEVGPFANVKVQIIADMEKLWNDMQKPDRFKASRVSDFFAFQFFALPYKVKTEEWNKGFAVLKKTFFDPNDNSDFVLDKKYKSAVPADGFCHYAGKIWETIRLEKDLDLPSQKQMLAIYRCEEISEAIITAVTGEANKLSARVDSGKEIINMGLEGNDLAQKAFGEYDEKTKLYDQKIREEKKIKLKERLSGVLGEVFKKQVEKIIQALKQQFDERMDTSIPEKKTTKEVGLTTSTIQSDIMNLFTQKVQLSQIPGFSWSTVSQEEMLLKHIVDRINYVKKSQLNLWLEHFHKSVQTKLTKILSVHFVSAKPDMWNDVTKHYNAEKAAAEKEFSDILAEIKYDKQDNKIFQEELEKTIFSSLRLIVESEVRNLESTMTSKFKKIFEHVEDGSPRKWSSPDQVESQWRLAKAEAEEALDLFALIRIDYKYSKVKLYDPKRDNIVLLDTDHVPDELQTLAPNDAIRILQRFRENADASYKLAHGEAERAAAHASMPSYMIWLLLALGWNEIWFVLSYMLFNPFGFLLGVLLAILAYVIYTTNTWPLVRNSLLALLSEGQNYVRYRINLLQMKAPKKAEHTKTE